MVHASRRLSLLLLLLLPTRLDLGVLLRGNRLGDNDCVCARRGFGAVSEFEECHHSVGPHGYFPTPASGKKERLPANNSSYNTRSSTPLISPQPRYF